MDIIESPAPLADKSNSSACPSSSTWTSGRTRVTLFLTVVLILIAYSDSFTVPFLLDDFDSVVNNQTIRHLGNLGAVLSPPLTAGVGGRPVLNLLFAWDYTWSQLNPFGYHVTNLGIHILCTLLIFGVVRRTVLRLGEKFAPHSDLIAWGVCALWGVQPLHTISVTYISQRAESLMGLFFLAAMYCFISSNHYARSKCWKAASVFSLVLGVLVKEQVAIAPLLFLLYDRTFIAGSFRAAWTARRNYYLATLLTWVVLGFSLAIAPRQQVGAENLGSLSDYIFTDAEALLRYIKLSVFPQPLIFDYGTQTTPKNAVGWALLVSTSFLVACTFVLLRRAPNLGFLGAWFFLILAPTTTVIPIRLQPIGENRVYLPSLALITAVVIASVYFFGPRAFRYLVGVILVYAVSAWSRNLDYRNELAIWKDTAEKRPTDARAHLNLGLALVRAGHADDGVVEYHRALALRPDFMKAHYNLGCVLLDQDQIEAAVEELTKARALQPGYAPIYNNLGLAQQHLGQTEAAIVTLRTGLSLDPEGIEMRFNLGNSLCAAGKLDEAVEAFTYILRSRPQLAEAYLERARAYRGLHRFSEAQHDYREALKFRPGWSLPENELQGIPGGPRQHPAK